MPAICGQSGHRRGPRRGRAGCASAFTLVELLAAVSIIALLIAILLPALAHSIRAARGFRCQMSMRSLAFDFSVFADDMLHGDRGTDPADLRSDSHFRVETFQESQYGIDEFWRWGDTNIHTVPDVRGNDPMRCASMSGYVTLRRNAPCSSGGVSPPQNISYGFNMRLHRGESTGPSGQPRTYDAKLTTDILQHGDVPLAWDVDGRQAFANNASPVFSAPSLDSAGPYAGDRYWYPGRRHNGSANFAFVGGHVLASARPLAEEGWQWSYQPPR